MRILKLGAISFFAFFLLLFLMSLLIPRQVRVSRAINIHAAREKVYPLIAGRQHWEKWNELSDSAIRVSITAGDGNEITTTWARGGRQLASAFRMEESANITVVQWYFDFRLKWYPWEKFGSIVLDKQFGPAMERSLNNLKKLVENSP